MIGGLVPLVAFVAVLLLVLWAQQSRRPGLVVAVAYTVGLLVGGLIVLAAFMGVRP